MQVPKSISFENYTPMSHKMMADIKKKQTNKSILGYFNSTVYKIFKCFKQEFCGFERDFVQMPAD